MVGVGLSAYVKVPLSFNIIRQMVLLERLMHHHCSSAAALYLLPVSGGHRRPTRLCWSRGAIVPPYPQFLALHPQFGMMKQTRNKIVSNLMYRPTPRALFSRLGLFLKSRSAFASYEISFDRGQSMVCLIHRVNRIMRC